MEPTALTTAIARHRRRQRLGAALTGFGCGLVAWAIATPLLVGCDAWLRPDDDWRWGIWCLATGMSLACTIRYGRALFRHCTPVTVAADLDRRARIPGGLLAAGASFTVLPPSGGSAWMTARTIALATQTAAGLRDWPRISPIPRTWPLAGGVALAALILCGLHPGLQPWLLRAWWPGAATGRPGSLQVVTWPDNGLAPIGSEPEIGATLDGTALRVQAELQWADGRHEQRLLEPDHEHSWRMTLPPLTCGVQWRILADRDGDGRWDGMSHRHHLDLAPGFAAPSVLVRVVAPTYSLLPDALGVGDVHCLAGSELVLQATIPKGGPRLVAATVVLQNDGGEAPREIPAHLGEVVAGEMTVHANFIVRGPLQWGLRLIAAGGREEIPDRRWRVTTSVDQPPRISLDNAPAVLAADAVATLAAVAEDDVGLDVTELELHLDLSQGPLLARVPFTGEARRRNGQITLDLAALGAQPGQLLVLIPNAIDRAGNQTRGAPATITVSAPGTATELEVADAVHQVDALLKHAQNDVPGLLAAWDRAGNASNDPARHLARARIDAWGRALHAACAGVQLKTGSQHADAIAQAVNQIRSWSQTIETIEPAALPGALDRQRTTLQELRTTSERLASHVIAAAEAAAIARQARSLQADLTWGAKFAMGLSAAFSRDGDGAPVVTTGVELPEFTDRIFPGELGPDAARIAYRGLILIPQGEARLVVTADDGVRLRIAGIDQLPAEAWHDHPTTAWSSAALPAGWQRIELDYRQNAGGSRLALAWLGGNGLTAEELRAGQAPDDLAGIDASEGPQRTSMLDRLLDRIARHELPEVARLADLRAPPGGWTVPTLAAISAEAQAIAANLAPVNARRSPDGALMQRGNHLHAGRLLAEQELRRAVAVAAVELREHGAVASAESLEHMLPPAVIAEPAPHAAASVSVSVTVSITSAMITTSAATVQAAITSSGTQAADAGLADAKAETAARRLASGLARLQEANERLGSIAAYQDLAPVTNATPAAPAPTAATDAGWARSRMALPQLNDVGIDAFRPDQQRAIRQYLDRLRHQGAAP